MVQETIGQSKNDQWFLYRKHEIISSEFGDIVSACQKKKKTILVSLLKSLNNEYNISRIHDVEWSLNNQIVALKFF